MLRRKIVFILLILGIYIPKLLASPVPYDTVRKFNPSLVLFITDTSEAAKRARTEQFYGNLKNTFYRRKLTRQIFDLVFDATPTSSRRISYVEPVQNEYEAYRNKYIGKISYKSLDLFGPTVYDTLTRPQAWYARIGNRFHVHTQPWVIRKNLLFEEGELLNPNDLADNERILRRLNFVRDARIYVKGRATTTDTVDIEVITQDVFPLEIGGSRNKVGDYGLSLNNTNMFGIGHQLDNTLVYTSDRSPTWGYLGSYQVQNIWGTFFDARVDYRTFPSQKGAGVSVQRTFFTPEIKWAGGAELSRYQSLNYLTFIDSTLDYEVRYDRDYLNFWAARAFPLDKQQLLGKGRTALILGLKSSRSINYRPDNTESEEVADFFIDQERKLASLGISSQLFRRDRFIYGFGRTEDVPLGFYFNTLIGQESRDNLVQNLYQLSAGYGKYHPKLGYIFGQLNYTKYIAQAPLPEQDLQQAGLTFISKLVPVKRYKFRQVLRLEGIIGNNRPAFEYLTIRDNQIAGVSGIFTRGNQRFSIHTESVFFSRLELLGFRFAGITYADLAWVDNNQSFSPWQGQSVAGFGLGIRVRNENLVFKTFELRATYYPKSNGLNQQFGVSLSGLSLSRFANFRLGEPNLTGFR